MSGARSTARRQRLLVEGLEGRSTPATFGVPWSDPSHLSLSFVPDGAPIAGHVSTLFQQLEASMPTATWQREILRAFQTWAVQANIDIGLVADGGQTLGIAGNSQHDPRFGDIRVGGQRMASDVLAISVPNDPAVSSTLTGDVLVNANDTFGSGNLDLFAVLLHEAGHVFGIGDSTDPKSPMYSTYQGTKNLAAADISALQALHGARSPDRNEGSNGNDTVAQATVLQPVGGDTGALPLVAYGDVSTTKDVDVFAFKVPAGYKGPLTLRLLSAGISLLAPDVTLTDAKGRVLGQVQASSGRGDMVMIHLNQVAADATYFIRVRGATNDVFGIGRYGLAVGLDGRNTIPATTIESVLRGPYESLPSSDVAAILKGDSTVRLNDDQHHDDDPISATTLTSTPGYARDTHFEVIGSLSGPNDTDYYRIKAGISVLTVTARALDIQGAVPRITLLDGDGMPVPFDVIANGDGMFSIQAKELKGGGYYLLKVGPATAAGSTATGNYSLTANYGNVAANLATLANTSLPTTSASRGYKLYVGQTQLMHLALVANGTGPTPEPGAGARMTIVDKTGKTVASLDAALGDTVTGPDILLTPGAYTIFFTTLVPTANPLKASLLGAGISDPIGPVLSDPTLAPEYVYPGLPGWYLYPDGTLTQSPYYLEALALD